MFIKYVRKNEKENVVVSPYSVINLLVMSAQATAGGTRDEIIKALLPDGTYDDLMALVSDLISKISDEDGVYSYNAALVKKEIGSSIQEEYRNQLKAKLYGDLLITDDLIASANKWVDEKTEGMIQKIMNDEDKSKTEILTCLINAILFRADWRDEYEEDDIEENSKFTNVDGTVSHVTMLRSGEEEYVENKYFAGFIKPYKNGFSYMALLPFKQEKVSLLTAIKKTDFRELYESKTKKTVTAKMPEYTCEFEDDLNPVCEKFGIKTIFTDQADFANMSSERLYLGAIVHKSKIEVDRQGTRAAAVTAGGAGGCDFDFDEFRDVTLDRPFVYAIIHNETGIPVFVGTVNTLPDEKKTFPAIK